MIYIDDYSKRPLYEQIYEQIKSAIKSGEIPVGAKLPATRALAKELCIGRNTVENAYQQLLVEGYVWSKIGSGYIVMDIAEEMLQSGQTTAKNTQKYFHDSKIVEAEKSEDHYPPVLYDFHFKNMDSEFFPYKLWRKYTTQLLSYYGNSSFTSYNNKQGEHNLRFEILKYLYELRGVECDAEQIVVCCGLQFALEKVCSLIPKEYHHVGFEEPGYDSARLVFEKHNFKITPIPVYPDAGPPVSTTELLEKNKVKTIFLTPSHQFPTGYILPVSDRYKVLKWAQGNDCYIIEDDYDSEYRYNSKPIPSLHSLDTDDRVIYLGTFSKVLSPSLRISYLVLPKHLVPTYHEVYQCLEPTASWLQQETLALYMKDGHLEKHLRKTFQQYKERHDCIIQAINEQLGDNVQIIGQNAGLHIMLKVNGAVSQEDLIHKAREHGVKVYPTSPYWMVKENCPPDTIMIGYAQLDSEGIPKGIRQLKEAWFSSPCQRGDAARDQYRTLPSA